MFQSFVEKNSGCVELPNANFNCFIISTKETITECGKSLPRTTYIYGEELLTYRTDTLKEQYQIEGTDYELFGKMQIKMFNSLINCLKRSKTVKNKYKKLL